MAKTDKAETKSLTKADAVPTKLQAEVKEEKAEAKKPEAKAEEPKAEAKKPEPKPNPMAKATLKVSIAVTANGGKPMFYEMKEVAPSKNYRKFAIKADEDQDVYGQVYIWTSTEE